MQTKLLTSQKEMQDVRLMWLGARQPEDAKSSCRQASPDAEFYFPIIPVPSIRAGKESLSYAGSEMQPEYSRMVAERLPVVQAQRQSLLSQISSRGEICHLG